MRHQSQALSDVSFRGSLRQIIGVSGLPKLYPTVPVARFKLYKMASDVWAKCALFRLAFAGFDRLFVI